MERKQKVGKSVIKPRQTRWNGQLIGNSPEGRLTRPGAERLVEVLKAAVSRIPKEQQAELRLNDPRRYPIKRPQNKRPKKK